MLVSKTTKGQFERSGVRRSCCSLAPYGEMDNHSRSPAIIAAYGFYVFRVGCNFPLLTFRISGTKDVLIMINDNQWVDQMCGEHLSTGFINVEGIPSRPIVLFGKDVFGLPLLLPL